MWCMVIRNSILPYIIWYLTMERSLINNVAFKFNKYITCYIPKYELGFRLIKTDYNCKKIIFKI